MPPKRKVSSKKAAGGPSRPGEPSREVLFEFIPIGNSVKVSAIDAQTGIEVAMVGPAKASQEDLKRTAAAKLFYVMEKKAKQAQTSKARASAAKGKRTV